MSSSSPCIHSLTATRLPVACRLALRARVPRRSSRSRCWPLGPTRSLPLGAASIAVATCSSPRRRSWCSSHSARRAADLCTGRRRRRSDMLKPPTVERGVRLGIPWRGLWHHPSDLLATRAWLPRLTSCRRCCQWRLHPHHCRQWPTIPPDTTALSLLQQPLLLPLTNQRSRCPPLSPSAAPLSSGLIFIYCL